jgi:hypothetical protein
MSVAVWIRDGKHSAARDHAADTSTDHTSEEARNMIHHSFRVVTVAGCCAMVALLATVSQARGQSREQEGASPAAKAGGAAQKARVSVEPLLAFSDHSVVYGGGSALVRTEAGAYMSLHAFGLPAGNAVTAWFVIFNNPEKCATHPCTVADLQNADAQPSLVNATGRVVGADGTADFGSFRGVGDATGAVIGSGLLNPFKAEIHLVVRSHGPAILDNPQTLLEQLSTFTGGCPPNTCGNLQVSIHTP